MSKLALSILLASLPGFAQDHHHADVNKRGDHTMGFSHEKTAHHFRLFADGGAIEVTANDRKDEESKTQIRTHLSHIATMFAAGNFQAPMLIHDRVPPGVPVMQQRKAEITYRFEPVENGGRVRITTKSPQALAAIHDFLRFQIEDHQTGDPTAVTRAATLPRAPRPAYRSGTSQPLSRPRQDT